MKTPKQPDFAAAAQMMSGPTILEFARSGRAFQRAAATSELRVRIAHGRVDDLDHEAIAALDLI